jgi:pyruvate,orthophosphate dikinase
VPEARILAGWARELGIAIGEAGPPEAPAGAGEPAGGEEEAMATSTEDAVRVLAIKGYCDAAGLAGALGCGAEDAAAALDLLVAQGLAELAAGSFRLTADGKAVGAEHLAADGERWGRAQANAALDAFIALDHRMKAIVTDWQMKGEGVFNDHADAAYDASVLARLGELHADVETWLAGAAAGLPRLARYGDRLGAAAAAATAGDGRYIASPRVDSYHGAWFELHEDLIGLAGRTRADEVAAGRA